MQGQKEDGKVGVGADFVADAVTNTENGVKSEGKKADKKKVVLLVMAILVVIEVGLGVWWWRKRNREIEEGDVMYIGMMPEEENERKEAMWAAYGEAGREINEIAGQNGGVTSRRGEKDVYNYEIVEENINKYLEGIEDGAKKSQVAAFAVVFLSGIGDTEGAGRMVEEIETEEFSEVEWFCYYQAMRSYYVAIGDKDDAKVYADLVQEIVMETMTEEEGENI